MLIKDRYLLTEEGVRKVKAALVKETRKECVSIVEIANCTALRRETVSKILKRTGGVNRASIEALCRFLRWDFEKDLKKNIHYKLQETMLGRIVGKRYRINKHLGSGEFIETYFAEDLYLPGKPQCVVKRRRSQSSNTATRVFEREARVLAQLGEHNQIPSLFALFQEDEDFYLVHELIEGHALSQELIEGQPWSESQVIALVQDILEILMFLHQQNVIHRGIKPQNLIRRGSDNKIVLTNFGSVKQISPGQTRTFSSTNDGYIPPEQGSGVPQLCSDIYAVGILSIQALTGLHPRRLKADYHTGNIVWREKAPQVSPKFVNFINNTVRYDFRTRYPSAAEALQALQSL